MPQLLSKIHSFPTILFLAKFWKHFENFIHELSLLPFRTYNVPPGSPPGPLQIMTSFALIIVNHRHIHTGMYTYNLLSLFTVAHVDMSLGLTPWDWLICQGSSPWRVLSIPLSSAIRCLCLFMEGQESWDFPHPLGQVGSWHCVGLDWETSVDSFTDAVSLSYTQDSVSAATLVLWLSLSLFSSSSVLPEP